MPQFAFEGSAPYPPNAVPITANAVGTTGAVAATLAAASGKFTWITGFVVVLSNPTAAASVTITVSGVTTNIVLSPNVLAAAATTLQPPPIVVTLPLPVPSSAVNTAIVVTLSALGAGAPSASVSAFGYQL